MAAARDLAEDLARLSEQDPDNVEARYHLVVALYQQALAVRRQMQSTADTARALLRRGPARTMPSTAGLAQAPGSSRVAGGSEGVGAGGLKRTDRATGGANRAVTGAERVSTERKAPPTTGSPG